MSQSDAAKPLKTLEAQPMPGFHVVGVSQRISNEDDSATDAINGLWQHFFEDDVLHKIPHRTENVVYAIYSDYEGDHTKPYRLTIGCKVSGEQDNTPDGLHKVFIPQGNYALFSAKGEQPQALVKTWQGIWAMEFGRNYVADVEIYGPRFFEEGVNEVIVCVGVHAQSTKS